MGANIALLNYFYDVSFHMKLHVFKMSSLSVICISHIVIVSSIYAIVRGQRDLIKCRDGINDINYCIYDDITVII